ncbi:MAG: response regulator transcription factor [Bacteroidetes bacterium]|nr:response regulator transcription factor [Bacteroidota bacterium]
MKILIADDHAIVRKGLKQILEESSLFSQVDEANDGIESLSLIHENKYDIVILDLSMPGMDGFELLSTILKSYPEQKILVLSTFSEDRYAVRVIKSGASGYLRKTSAPEELITALVTISNGHKYITPNVADKLADELGHLRSKPLHDYLSDRELQTMIKIAEGKSLTDIAEELLLSKKTISTYRARVLEKMNMKNNSELIKYVIEHDLLSGT